MKSRVFRNPVGLAASQYVVREGGQITAIWHTNGDNVSLSFSDEAKDRISEVSCTDSSSNVSARSPGREYKESIRGIKRSLLPIRQEPEKVRIKENERSNEEGSQWGPSSNICSGRWKGISSSGFQIEEGSEESGRKESSGSSGIDQEYRSIRNSEEKTKECFIDQNRPCTDLCTAYSTNKAFKEPCRILRLIDRLAPVRHDWPTPPAPKVGK